MASQGPSTTILGTVDAVEAVINRTRIDIVIYMPGGGALPDNSRMLWRAKDGTAVGIHAISAYADNAADSRYSDMKLRLSHATTIRLIAP